MTLLGEIALWIALPVALWGAILSYVGGKKERGDLVLSGERAVYALLALLVVSSAGVVDAFQEANLPVFGPSKVAAQLEGSKVFCKKILHAADVPTAERTADGRLGRYWVNWLRHNGRQLYVYRDGRDVHRCVAAAHDQHFLGGMLEPAVIEGLQEGDPADAVGGVAAGHRQRRAALRADADEDRRGHDQDHQREADEDLPYRLVA